MAGAYRGFDPGPEWRWPIVLAVGLLEVGFLRYRRGLGTRLLCFAFVVRLLFLVAGLAISRGVSRRIPWGFVDAGHGYFPSSKTTSRLAPRVVSPADTTVL